MTGAIRLTSLLWIGLALATLMVGCTSKAGPSSGPTRGSGSSATIGEGTPAEMRGDIREAQLELATARGDLAELSKSGAKLDPDALDAILVRLERASGRLDEILERASAIESTGGE